MSHRPRRAAVSDRLRGDLARCGVAELGCRGFGGGEMDELPVSEHSHWNTHTHTQIHDSVWLRLFRSLLRILTFRKQRLSGVQGDGDFLISGCVLCRQTDGGGGGRQARRYGGGGGARKLRQRRRRGTVLGVLPVVLSVQVLGPLPAALTFGCLLGSQRPAGLLGAFLIGWFVLTTSSD